MGWYDPCGRRVVFRICCGRQRFRVRESRFMINSRAFFDMLVPRNRSNQVCKVVVDDGSALSKMTHHFKRKDYEAYQIGKRGNAMPNINAGTQNRKNKQMLINERIEE